ncbi:hypothetical protein [Streptomyces sp. NPDC056387]|uniref:hypothetical protein n=1 Tax=Streptomyces sp. NPDC056387 TaxID=3345803 RepID=UPI0035DB5A56
MVRATAALRTLRTDPEARTALSAAYVHELDPATRGYGAAGIFHGRLKVDVPFPVDLDLDLTEITAKHRTAGWRLRTHVRARSPREPGPAP